MLSDYVSAMYEKAMRAAGEKYSGYSVHLIKRYKTGSWYLQDRTYYSSQSPDYTLLCILTIEEAKYLYNEKHVYIWMGTEEEERELKY